MFVKKNLYHFCKLSLRFKGGFKKEIAYLDNCMIHAISDHTASVMIQKDKSFQFYFTSQCPIQAHVFRHSFISMFMLHYGLLPCLGC